MQGQDRRVMKTQQQLARALIALTLEKGYDAVTIREITERADVGYATFFRHYRAKDDLLNDVLEVVLAELIELLSSLPIANEPEITGQTIFSYVQTHAEVVRVLLDSHVLHQKLFDLSMQSTMQGMQGMQAAAEHLVPMDIVIQHVVASSMALIEWWLKQGMPYSPEKMGRIYAELIARPTSVFLLPAKNS